MFLTDTFGATTPRITSAKARKTTVGDFRKADVTALNEFYHDGARWIGNVRFATTDEVIEVPAGMRIERNNNVFNYMVKEHTVFRKIPVKYVDSVNFNMGMVAVFEDKEGNLYAIDDGLWLLAGKPKKGDVLDRHPYEILFKGPFIATRSHTMMDVVAPNFALETALGRVPGHIRITIDKIWSYFGSWMQDMFYYSDKKGDWADHNFRRAHEDDAVTEWSVEMHDQNVNNSKPINIVIRYMRDKHMLGLEWTVNRNKFGIDMYDLNKVDVDDYETYKKGKFFKQALVYWKKHNKRPRSRSTRASADRPPSSSAALATARGYASVATSTDHPDALRREAATAAIRLVNEHKITDSSITAACGVVLSASGVTL